MILKLQPLKMTQSIKENQTYKRVKPTKARNQKEIKKPN